MKNFTSTKSLTIIAGLIATAFITGCDWNHGERFEGDTALFYANYHQKAPNSIGNVAEAQSAAGAKEDAMLYEMHFHGSELTSLGQGKLDLIVKGTPAGDPVTVYLNLPHDLVADRQAAVRTYLKTAGVSDQKMIVAEGPNSNLTTPAAYNLSGLYKADGASYNGQAAADTASGLGTAAATTSH